MKYKLMGNETYKYKTFSEKILLNRGIENPIKYLNLTDKDIYPYTLLDNIKEAVELLNYHISKNSNITLIVDCDSDGYCSSAVLYSYLCKIYNSKNITYLVHTGKQHGLTDDVFIPKETNLLILADSGSNDYDQCKKLKELGIQIIILDHHEKNSENQENAIIINPKWDFYPNKELSGTAVVYKFLQAMDDENWTNYADNYLDLVALSLISDGMDIKSYETRRLIDKGMTNIHNRMFISFIEKQSYSIGADININNIQFYVVPLINGLIRSGTQEEKEMMFRGFCEIYEEFDYKKRGETEIQTEDIFTRVARLATNAKAKQNREIDKALEQIERDIEKYNWNDHKILWVNGAGIDNNFTGLIAMKLAGKYNKPCLMLKEMYKDQTKFGGSGRNYNNSEIEDFRGFLESTELFEYAQGHSGAFGIAIDKENLKPAILKTDEMLVNFNFDKVYAVDFILSPDQISYQLVKEIDNLKNLWGQGVPESMIAIENFEISSNDIGFTGKDKDSNTMKFNVNDNVVAIKFKVNTEDELYKLCNEDWAEKIITMNLVGRVGISEYQGISSPQFYISDYEILN